MRKAFLTISFNLFIIILFVSACNNRNRRIDDSPDIKEIIINDLNKYYLGLKNQADSNLTKHFPSYLDSNNLVVSGPPIDTDSIYTLEVTNRITDKALFENYSESSIAIFSADDQCVLPYQKFESIKQHPNGGFRECLVDKHPFPDFVYSDYSDYSNQSRLSRDFDIYILESRPGNNFADSLITNNNLLLKKWETGFSRGVAISEEKMIIIYWAISWD